jgi:hypothetical protein
MLFDLGPLDHRPLLKEGTGTVKGVCLPLALHQVVRHVLSECHGAPRCLCHRLHRDIGVHHRLRWAAPLLHVGWDADGPSQTCCFFHDPKRGEPSAPNT